MNRSARIILAVFVLVAVMSLFYAKRSIHSSPPPQATQTNVAPALQQAAAPASRTGDRAEETAGAASASALQKKVEPQPLSAPTSGGLVAVIDPATGQLRQADASDIAAATATPAPAGLQRRAALAPQAVEVQTFTAPGGATGAVLGDDSMSFVVVTKTPDGKLSTECIDGKKVAEAKVLAKNRAKNKKQAEKKSQPSQQKENLDEM